MTNREKFSSLVSLRGMSVANDAAIQTIIAFYIVIKGFAILVKKFKEIADLDIQLSIGEDF